ncbi:protein OPI10 homolog isoform X4 [Diachasmimorpha longicaudata]|uniref:protein OPI10 homolog isoform X4 n=1 Tax=Diachasmimorpha longicaudata TaxID=58733 RepID=UPI0030B910F7
MSKDLTMFGIIVSGRLVDTNVLRMNDTQFLVTVPDADNVNHIVVFLTGNVPFPEGTGGAVYFSWPDPNAPPNWQFLGYISNLKPSAIFKIMNLKKNHEFENINDGIFGVGKISHVAQIAFL